MRRRVPTHVKWAAGIFMFLGGVLVLGAVLLVAVAEERSGPSAIGAVGLVLVGAGIVAVGFRLRRRDRRAHRIAVAIALLQVVVGAVGMFRGWAGLPWLPAVALWLLLRPPTRRWFAGQPLLDYERAPDEPSLAEINRRFEQRAIERD